jgi:HrpA-like RNA helicase
LVDCWVSRASAQQRRGRAGRVRPGIAYHLFSTHTYKSELQQYQICEMSRVGIEDLVLQILILDLGEPSTFLGRAITPPSAIAMRNALKLLEELGAVECRWQSSFDEYASCANLAETSTELTALGFHLATLPVEPRIGKLIIYGALFGCVDPALTIAAAMSSKNPFIAPFACREAADEARRTFSVEGSDHLTILEAFNQWRNIRRSKGERASSAFARDSFLSKMTMLQMEELRKQFASLLTDIGFLPSDFNLDAVVKGTVSQISDANFNAENMDLLKAVLCAGLYPNIILAPRPLVHGTSKQDAGEVAFQSRSKGEVYLHPSALLFSARSLEYRYCCYREVMMTRKLYVRDLTVVSPFALLLFGGALQVFHEEGVVTVDEWLKFRIARTPATLVKHLRAQMESMLLRKIVTPEDDVFSTTEAKAVISSVSSILRHETKIQRGDAARVDGAEIVRPWHGQPSTSEARTASSPTRGRHAGRGRHQSESRAASSPGRGSHAGRGPSRGGRGRGRSGKD